MTHEQRKDVLAMLERSQTELTAALAEERVPNPDACDGSGVLPAKGRP